MAKNEETVYTADTTLLAVGWKGPLCVGARDTDVSEETRLGEQGGVRLYPSAVGSFGT